MKDVKTHITSIKGLGIISSAVILSEYGDISLFDTPEKMQSYAGLDPSTFQSGTNQNQVGRMVKHGSSYLRYRILMCCFQLLSRNEVLYEYYRKKKDEGKGHWTALSHVARKLIRIIHHIETNDVDYVMK
jgi:transposase